MSRKPPPFGKIGPPGIQRIYSANTSFIFNKVSFINVYGGCALAYIFLFFCNLCFSFLFLDRETFVL